MHLIIELILPFVFATLYSVYASHREGKEQKIRKTSRYLCDNAITIERNVSEEEVFKTLDEAGITINFIKESE